LALVAATLADWLFFNAYAIGVSMPLFALACISMVIAANPIRAGARIVFEHLADNAARHGAKVLSIICRRADGMLWVTVQDDGAGISAANRQKIFTNFFTTRRDSGGTGMGLPIVRAMLESHGGGIKLADDEGESVGARFTLSVPLSLPEEDRP
jgi:signal transduction histidine kinase